jgi:hypothetical protein
MPNPVSSRDALSSSMPDDHEETPSCTNQSPPSVPSGTILGPHAEGHAQPDDLYAGAFAVKGRDASSGLELEVFSVSVHDGGFQGDAQVGMARVGVSSDDGHFNLRGEVFTAKAHLGIHNPDGSTGVNAGLGATIAGLEGTATVGPLSVTGGVSGGAVLAGSIGVRDGDGDGKAELCGWVEAGPWTVGACLERFW